MKICCAFGHREVLHDIRDKLHLLVKGAIEQGCRIFYTGDMGDFDRMFSYAVNRLKKLHPDVKLICVKPYFTNGINTKGEYYSDVYDDVIIPDELSFHHYKTAIKKRNEWMVNKSDIVLFYLRKDHGGAFTAYKYAQKHNKTLIKI